MQKPLDYDSIFLLEVQKHIRTGYSCFTQPELQYLPNPQGQQMEERPQIYKNLRRHR